MRASDAAILLATEADQADDRETSYCERLATEADHTDALLVTAPERLDSDAIYDESPIRASDDVFAAGVP